MRELKFKNATVTVVTGDSRYTAEEVKSSLGAGIPEDLITFWQRYEEIRFVNGIAIYGYLTAKERNSLYEVPQYSPNYIMVGDDSGGQGIFLQRKDPTHKVYYLDTGALGSAMPHSLNVDFFVWLENEPTLDTIDPAEDWLVKPAKVVVTRKPEELNKFIFEVKKIFDITTSLSEMKQGLDTLPYVLIEGVTLMKYKNFIDSLNAKYRCISVLDAKSPNKVLLQP
jgi:hypothetical protein